MKRNDPLTLAAGTGRGTPQSQPIAGREADMRLNDAGGYVFSRDLWDQAEVFLVLGVGTKGTWYSKADKLVLANADVIRHAIRADGPRLVQLIRDISTSRPPRAPKQNPSIFALAMAHAYGDAATREAVKRNFSAIVRTTDHLAMFFGYSKQFAGKAREGGGTSLRSGRSLRSALSSWFLDPDIDDVAFKACKARQRKTPAGERMELRDILRIAHTAPAGSERRRALLGWVAGKITDEQAVEVVPEIGRFLRAQAVTTAREAVKVVREDQVPWEFLPSEVLVHKTVWDELVSTIGQTALIRNLAKMTRVGTLAPGSEGTSVALRRLTDADALLKGRIHPVAILLAMLTYNSGRSQPDRKADVETWTPVTAVSGALETAWDLSFAHAERTGKRLLVVVDCSGSMQNPMMAGGSHLGTMYQVANMLAVTIARIEPNVQVINISDEVHPSQVTSRSSLADAMRYDQPGGGTDLSLPFSWAERKGLTFDGIVIITDDETWAGHWQHPSEAWESYRRTTNQQAKAVVVSMTATPGSIADPRDEGVLNIGGLDASLPQVISAWLR